MREQTAGRGADRVIELTGAYPGPAPGHPRAPAWAARWSPPASTRGRRPPCALGEEFHHNRVTLVSSQIGSVPTALRDRWTRERLHETVMSLCASGRLDPLPLVSHVHPGVAMRPRRTA